MSSYYTPSIEEFHIGFEYESEEDPIQGKWEKQKVNDYRDLINCMNYYGKDSDVDTRVKYLDQKNIESFNFEFLGKGVVDWYSIKKETTPGSRHKITEYKLSHNSNTNEIIIEAYFDKQSEGVVFEGFIINKSELKRLLKQLNIDE